MSPATSLHIAWAQLFVRSAFLAGVRDVVVSPGSRSTPLALAAHESPDVRSHFIVDERTAAFFALGQARQSGRPSLLVCTSGSAAAHYFPAVIEAAMSHLPMLVVTADRPWELQQIGASQTIDQTRLFGGFARMFTALGAPEPLESALRGVARTAAQAVATALGPEPGPVHVNAPFRKPLEPLPVSASSEPAAWTATWQALMQSGAARAVAPSSAPIDPAALDDVARIVSAAQRGLIACGPAPQGSAAADLDAYRRDLTALALATGFPVLAEATSQMRFGALASPHDRGPLLLSSFDALARSAGFRRRFTPDAILELGAPPTSAGYAQLLAENPKIQRIVVAPHGWSDPTSSAALLVRSDVAAFCRALAQRLGSARGEAPSEWSLSLAVEDARARDVADSALAEAESLSEGAVARAVIAACPPGSTLVLGNSSPVRDADAWVHASAKPLHVLHQRGASGIDGLVSGAAGAQTVSKGAVSLLLGDLSFLHDIGGLALAREAEGPLVIVVVNNAGGRIFEQLPIGRALGPGAAFERCFATPQPIDFAAAAATFGVAFERATTPAALGRALAAAHGRSKATLIEAAVPPHDGAARIKTAWTRIDAHYLPRKDNLS